jgi:signal transduction histidine kinase
MPTQGSTVEVGKSQDGGASGQAVRHRLVGRLGTLDRVQRALSTPSRFDGAFSPLVRRLGLIYVCVAVPFVTVLSIGVHGQRDYLFAFVFFASGAFTTPALVVASIGLRRAPLADRRWFELWFLGLVLTYATGVGILIGLPTRWHAANRAGGPIVALIASLFIMTCVGMVRERSGRRALTVDVLEAAMALVVIVAPCALVWGDRVLDAEASWFAMPAALALVAVVAGAYWTIVLLVRLGPEAGMLEASGVVLTLVGGADAAAQLAQGIAGFVLPAPPLIAVHATCMAMLFLLPLHLPRTASTGGLDRLPPQAQVRGGGLVALVTLVGVPVLLATTAWTAHRTSWATPFALGALAVLLVLGALRHLASVRETRRLYAQVEKASDERRALLARVMERADEDRHRVAAQLHEQAVSAYASFVSFIQACGPGGPGGPRPGGPLNGASTLVRDDLARHADSLRQLMLAIQPLESSDRGSPTLAAPIHAYLDNLYGDRRAPRLTVRVQDGLVLDWITETIALRIVQEAVRNVWRHSGAHRVEVSIATVRDETAAVDPIEVRVADDGVGFHPAATLFESGIAAMREFAAVLGGSATVTSAPGAGTIVTARLGGAPHNHDEAEASDRGGDRESARATPAQGQGRARLRLVSSMGGAARSGGRSRSVSR